MLFLCYKRCSTCRKARAWLEANDFDFEERDIKEKNPSEKEIKTWHKLSGLEIKKFFNTSGKLYREQGLKNKLPTMTDAEAYKLLATDGMLVKRPILVGKDFVLLGFNETAWAERLKG
ncbi:MAG: arsenate reductase family protein [Treponemataceae bacterium]